MARKGVAAVGRAVVVVLIVYAGLGPFAWAAAGTYQVSVEPGGVVAIDVLDRDKAPAGTTIETVGNAAHGNVAITADKRSVSYRAAGDYIGSDAFTYQGKDPRTNQEYTGRVEVSVVAPQRIVGLDYARVAGVLGIILVLALVLELGLATIFNWKYFQDHFEGRGLRTPIAILVAAFFTYFYGLDVVSDLLSAFTTKGASFDKTLPGYVITAFIVAGGSGTVNRLFAALGLRPPVQDNTPEARQQAQLTVQLTRGPKLAANARVNVTIDDQLVGTIDSGDRLPATGAYRLAPGAHTIKLEAIDTTGQPAATQHAVNLAPAAVVSVPMTLG